MLVQDLLDEFRILVGDSSLNTSDEKLIAIINSAIDKLVSTPKLSRAFTKHYTITLNSKNGTKWKLEGDFQRLADIPLLNFYTLNTGGDPCQLTVCPMANIPFYNKHGVVSLKRPGIPCEYTIEQEGDDTYLVLDRPCDVPLLIDYIAYGYPKPITSVSTVDSETGKIIPTEIDISKPIENIIINSMQEAFYKEAEDLAFAGATLDILTNKYIPEAIQMLNKKLGVTPPTILGEP